ncbi:hypothetical protein IC607_08585 [Cellulomonas sp. JH27-2]|uniref:hypothetical protein n=1 Tax=Cellulomonas sp. JH27-2 TaxID=2774139 RepID=UPI001781687A|nr:hypothetical protein [Cellulomonas sp. JH27-2]MBD8059023.1 hypothetical protein [Cellulomonas sp. JH27-2]
MITADPVTAAFDRHQRAAVLVGGVLGDQAVASELAPHLTCDEADALCAGLGLLRRWEDGLELLRQHADADEACGDDADRHAPLHGHEEALRLHLGAIVEAALTDPREAL